MKWIWGACDWQVIAVLLEHQLGGTTVDQGHQPADDAAVCGGVIVEREYQASALRQFRQDLVQNTRRHVIRCDTTDSGGILVDTLGDLQRL